MKTKFATTINRQNMFYWQSDRPFNGKETKEIFLDRHQKFNPKITKQAITYGMSQYGKSEKDSQVVKLDIPIASGSVNLVSKATLSDGTKIIIRSHPSNIPNGYFWVEKAATEYAAKAGIPVYKTYYIYDEKANFDFDFMLIEQLTGKNISKEMTLTPELDGKITRQTGYYAYIINSINTERYGFFNNEVAKKEGKLVGIHSKWKDHLYAALDSNLKYLVDQKIITTEQSNKLEQIFSQNENIIYCKQPHLIHNDIADWNQLANYEGNITGMIDWDECFSGDPIMEFAQYSLFYDEPRITWFKEGYTIEKALPDDFEEKFHLYKARYIISKLHLRQKKLEFEFSKFIKDKLDFGLKCLNDELKWYEK